MKNSIPDHVKPFLWSYNVPALDLEKHKNRIVKNVLNLGTRDAVRWLFETYEKREIAEVFRNSLESEWNKKSLNYWRLILGAEPEFRTRRERIESRAL